MSTNCNNGIVIPNLENDECNGKTMSTKCIIHVDSIPSLDLPQNSSQYEINQTLILALNSANNRIEALETLIENLETRIIDLETI